MNRLTVFDECLQEDLEHISDRVSFEPFDGKTLLITGATGLVGSVLTKTVLYSCEKAGISANIICIVRDLTKANNMFEEFLSQLKYSSLTFIKGDVVDELNVKGTVDYIVHAASPTSSKFFVTHPVETIHSAVIGTDHILSLAAEKGVSGLVYISSMEVYGSFDEAPDVVTEKDLGFIDPLSVRSCYSEGKRMCECLCAAYASEYSVPVTIARLAQTFGAGVIPTENRVFAQFARSAIKGEDIVLHTAGMSEGNYCYIGDAIVGILLLLFNGNRGEAYTVVNEQTHTTIRDMAEMVSKVLCNGTIKVVYDIPNDSLKYGYAPDTKMRLSSRKLRELGWKPEIGLEESYRRLIRSMKANDTKE